MKDNPNIWTISEEYVSSWTPDYTITFKKDNDKEIGKFDFNGDKLKFEGDVEESAQVFINFLLSAFNQRIEEIKKEAFDAGVKAEYSSYKDSFIDNRTN
ncbi:MAG: hypothetical protein EBU90_00155 [Proteobacteria bacterium]|nr:hypothetical protein [Pseudomonadota bacterium]NBP12844.1 hypothetical protein [bacterium]